MAAGGDHTLVLTSAYMPPLPFEGEYMSVGVVGVTGEGSPGNAAVGVGTIVRNNNNNNNNNNYHHLPPSSTTMTSASRTRKSTKRSNNGGSGGSLVVVAGCARGYPGQ